MMAEIMRHSIPLGHAKVICIPKSVSIRAVTQPSVQPIRPGCLGLPGDQGRRRYAGLYPRRTVSAVNEPPEGRARVTQWESRASGFGSNIQQNPPTHLYMYET